MTRWKMLKQFWVWTKEKILKFEKWILIVLGIGIIGAVGAIPQPIPQSELLVTDKVNIIGSRLDADIVQYAYKDLNKKIPFAENEVKRTSHSRTFKTGTRTIEGVVYNVFRAEVISGGPQYYRDADGEWYQIEYGTTTEGSWDRQVYNFPKWLNIALGQTTTSTYATSSDGTAYDQEAAEGIAWGALHGLASGSAH